MDLDVELGTADELERKNRQITNELREQEKILVHAEYRAQLLEYRLSKAKATATSFLAGTRSGSVIGTGNAREIIGNLKDVSDLLNGEISFRNVLGAGELAGTAFGVKDNSLFAKALGLGVEAAPFVAAYIKIAERTNDVISGKNLKELFDADKAAERTIKQVFKADVNVKDYIQSFDPGRIGGSFEERLLITRKLAEQSARDAATLIENPGIAAAILANYNDGNIVRPTPGSMRRFLPELAQTPEGRGWITAAAGRVDQFKKDKQANSEYLADHPIEYARYRETEAVLNAAEKRDVLRTQQWNTN
ncbi:MAG: hypothetical protein KIS92_00835 [Planctomycetota bacterium]|nr:hypothetical protein [Planctomycetota bacterium]